MYWEMDKILLATDGSKHSAKTIEQAIELSGKLDAEVTILYVIEGNPQMGYDQFSAYRKATANMEAKAKEVLEKTAETFKEKGLKVTTKLEMGHPSEIICKIAEKENFDIIILGSRGLGGITGMLLGSVSNSVAHCAKTNVFIVK